MFGFDLAKLSQLANPETLGKAMEFMNAWLAFMHKTGKKMDDLIAGVERLDNMAQYHADSLDEIKEQLAILISETNLTPELQERIEAVAGDDPRQRDMVPGSALDFRGVVWSNSDGNRSDEQSQ